MCIITLAEKITLLFYNVVTYILINLIQHERTTLLVMIDTSPKSDLIVNHS